MKQKLTETEKAWTRGFASCLAIMLKCDGYSSTAQELWSSGIAASDFKILKECGVVEQDMEVFNEYKKELIG